MNRKSRTLSKLGLDGDVTVVTLDDLLGDGKAHAEAARLGGEKRVGVYKGVGGGGKILTPSPPLARVRPASARQKRPKMRDRSSLAIPMPVSETETSTCLRSARTDTTTQPPSGV